MTATTIEERKRPMTREEKKVILASSAGTIFEWYDFYLYGSLAAIIGAQFFSAFPEATRNVFALLVNRVRLQGFIVSDRMDLWPGAMQELAGHVAAGRIRYRESIAEGLEAAPAAFLGMLRGENFGKQLVRIAPAGKIGTVPNF